MTRPTILLVDVSTGKRIERQMNDNEFAQYQIDLADEIKNKTKAETRALAKSKLLERMGLTEDEAKLLLS